VGPEGKNPKDADQWFERSTEIPGSWWPDWYAWLASQSGKKIKASKTAGNAEFPAIEAAPGSFVKVRAV
jgi:polyhydroxyalkanoate synthase